jgi:hypothetical protein
MGWERRPNKQGAAYFYRSVRVGDRVRKLYYGRGQAGHEAAAAQELKRQGRLEAKKLLQDARKGVDEHDQLATELREWAEVLISTWLIMTGHRKRRGQWRRTSRG